MPLANIKRNSDMACITCLKDNSACYVEDGWGQGRTGGMNTSLEALISFSDHTVCSD